MKLVPAIWEYKSSNSGIINFLILSFFSLIFLSSIEGIILCFGSLKGSSPLFTHLVQLSEISLLIFWEIIPLLSRIFLISWF